jgi:hypothetical protein
MPVGSALSTWLPILLAVPSAVLATRGLLKEAQERRENVGTSRRIGRRTMAELVVAAVAVIVFIVAISGGGKPSPEPVKKDGTGHKKPPHEETVPVLSDRRLTALLVPKGSYEPLFPDFYDILDEDEEEKALQGGIAHLTLCSDPIPVDHLGQETASAYVSTPIGVRPDIYFGSDAASFKTRQAAERLLNEAGEEGEVCGWRVLPGSRLGEQAVRLTMDKNENGDSLHADVVLVRDRGSVVEIGIETTRGAHSADAGRLAATAAIRLAHAVSVRGALASQRAGLVRHA